MPHRSIVHLCVVCSLGMRSTQSAVYPIFSTRRSTIPCTLMVVMHKYIMWLSMNALLTSRFCPSTSSIAISSSWRHSPSPLMTSLADICPLRSLMRTSFDVRSGGTGAGKVGGTSLTIVTMLLKATAASRDSWVVTLPLVKRATRPETATANTGLIHMPRLLATWGFAFWDGVVVPADRDAYLESAFPGADIARRNTLTHGTLGCLMAYLALCRRLASPEWPAEETLVLEDDGCTHKWMPRERTGSEWMARTARILREALGLTAKEYRKLLVGLTHVVETPMCAGKWDAIEFGKVPSVAHAMYRNAFERCEHPACHKQPTFGITGSRARFCSDHKFDGMDDVKNKRCELIFSYASTNMATLELTSYPNTITLRELHKWAHKTIHKVGVLASKATMDPNYRDLKDHITQSIGKLEVAIAQFLKKKKLSSSEIMGLNVIQARISNLKTVMAVLQSASAPASGGARGGVKPRKHPK